MDHHYLSAQNKIQHHHWIRPGAKIRVDANKWYDNTQFWIWYHKGRWRRNASTLILPKVIYRFQILAAAILDHHYLSAQNKIQCFHCILNMRKPRYRHHNHASTLIISKVMFNFVFHKIWVMTILDLCKLEKFPKVATLARGGFRFWKP